MTKMGMKRTIPQLHLKRKKGLNKMSDKAKEELKIWLAIKEARMLTIKDKFGATLCEMCHLPTKGNELYQADGHHLDWNRRHNFPANCRILHRVCHSKVHDLNIKEIPSVL